jgi:hypothetical protein
VKLFQFILLISFFLISSCGTSQNAEAIQVKIDNQISQYIKIISATSRTGKTNPIEVDITLKNIATTPQQVLLKGRWLDSKGGFNGGAERVLKFAAGQSQTITEVKRSPRVASFNVNLKATEKSQTQLLNESLVSNTRMVAKGYGMTYSDTPATEKIPDLPIRGVANRSAF